MAQNMFNQVMPRLVNPTTAVDDSSQRVWGTVTNALGRIADTSLRSWQEATIKEKAKEGQMAGQNAENPEDIPMDKYAGLSGEAFQAAAIKSSTIQQSTQIQVDMEKLRTQSGGNVAEYEKLTSAYIKTREDMWKTVPALAPLRDTLVPQMKSIQVKQTQDIVKQHFNEQAELAKVNTNEGLATVMISNGLIGNAMLSSDPAMQSRGQQALEENLQKVDILTSGVDPLTNRPYFTPAEKEIALNAVKKDFWAKQTIQKFSDPKTTDEERLAIMDGSFKVTMNTDKGPVEVNPMYEVGEGYYKSKVVPEVTQKLRADNAMHAQQEAAHEKAIVKRAAEINGELIYREKQGNPASYEELVSLLHSHAITESQFTQRVNAIGKEPVDFTPRSIKVKVNTLANVTGDIEAAKNYLNDNAEQIDPDYYNTKMAELNKLDNERVKADTKILYDALKDAMPKKNMFNESYSDADKVLADIWEVEQRNIANGMNPELARSASLTSIERYRTKDPTEELAGLGSFSDTYSRHFVMNNKGVVDTSATMAQLKWKRDHNRITGIEYNREVTKVNNYIKYQNSQLTEGAVSQPLVKGVEPVADPNDTEDIYQ